MGLELLELTLALEEEFEMQFDDSELSNLTTPGLVADRIYSRVRKIGEPCPSTAGFYLVRRSLVESIGVKRSEVRPNSPLGQLLKGDVRKNWATLEASLGVRLPRLSRGRILWGGIALVPAVVLIPVAANGWPPALLVIAYGLTFLLAERATSSLGGRRVPSELAEVSNLIPYVGCSSSTEWSREAVVKRVIEITAAELGLPVAVIREDSDFVKDLGAG